MRNFHTSICFAHFSIPKCINCGFMSFLMVPIANIPV